MGALIARSTGRCPHCLTTVRFEPVSHAEIPTREQHATGKCTWMRLRSPNEEIQVNASQCPACGKLVICLDVIGCTKPAPDLNVPLLKQRLVAWPPYGARRVRREVPPTIAADYKEAAAVIGLSPKASAALSRRCLQAVLRDAGADQRILAEQIKAVLPKLPPHIAENVDAIRNVGNFAAHPVKSERSGEIVDVEPEEAEWNLDVLDMLFDFYYVQPTEAKEKRDALNKKLAGAGKPPMKSPKAEK